MKKVLLNTFIGLVAVVALVGIINGVMSVNEHVKEYERAQEIESMMQELRDRGNGSRFDVFNVAGTDMTHVEFFESVKHSDDFNFTTYEITDVTNNDIYGDMIKSQDSNMVDGSGVYLDADELDIDLKAGDKIMVIFENSFDDSIVDVKKIK